jgi:mRNA interferase HicA
MSSGRAAADILNIRVDRSARNSLVAFMNSVQAKRYLAKKGATYAPGKGGCMIVTLNGERSVLPRHGGSKEIGKGLW